MTGDTGSVVGCGEISFHQIHVALVIVGQEVVTVFKVTVITFTYASPAWTFLLRKTGAEKAE